MVGSSWARKCVPTCSCDAHALVMHVREKGLTLVNCGATHGRKRWPYLLLCCTNVNHIEVVRLYVHKCSYLISPFCHVATKCFMCLNSE